MFKNYLNRIVLTLMLSAIISIYCSDNSTEPETNDPPDPPVPVLDGRGGGIIAFI